MRKFIVIDNDPQDDEVTNIEGKAKDQGFNVEGEWFDPTDSECLTDDQEHIDIDRVINQLNAKYQGRQIDIVLIDFSLSDDKIDGVDLAIQLKQKWRRGNFLMLMYSGDYDELMEKLEKEWDAEFFNDFKQQYKAIKQHFKYFPVDTFDRNKKMADELIKYLKLVRIDMEQILLQNLKLYPENIFENIHPMFVGKKLKEITKMIENNSHEGEEFKSEIIERSIAHFIHLNE